MFHKAATLMLRVVFHSVSLNKLHTAKDSKKLLFASISTILMCKYFR